MVAPKRSNGRERVSGILDAAARVMRERGYDAATMREIAARSQANTGSLYHFFPSKEALADALILRYTRLVDAEFDRIDSMARSASIAELADLLIDFMVKINDETMALIALLEARSEWSNRRQELRGEALNRIAAILKRRAPRMDRKTAMDVAVVVLHNMKTLVAVTLDPNAATSRGAPEQLRLMNRLYLTEHLRGLD
jgi:AcrR family transcriptional regulator